METFHFKTEIQSEGLTFPAGTRPSLKKLVICNFGMLIGLGREPKPFEYLPLDCYDLSF